MRVESGINSSTSQHRHLDTSKVFLWPPTTPTAARKAAATDVACVLHTNRARLAPMGSAGTQERRGQADLLAVKCWGKSAPTSNIFHTKTCLLHTAVPQNRHSSSTSENLRNVFILILKINVSYISGHIDTFRARTTWK